MFPESDFASGVLAAIGHCLMLLALLTWLLLCPGCRPAPTATPTATITPSPTLPPPSPTPQDPLFFLNPEVRLYLDETEPFASTIAFVRAMSMSVSQLEEVLNQLRAIVPPPALAQAHEELIAAYDYLRQGMVILSASPPPDNVLRAEAYFLQDWGLKCLRDHQEMVSQYIETQRQRLTPAPEADFIGSDGDGDRAGGGSASY